MFDIFFIPISPQLIKVRIFVFHLVAKKIEENMRN